MSKRCGLSGATLKLIACVTMVIDHAGLLLFPEAQWMRYVGRLAFPIFAFFIAEGCRYTKRPWRYWLRVTALGVVCEAAYMLAGYPYYGNILLTFSCSIAITCLCRYALKNRENPNRWSALIVACLGMMAIGFAVGRFGVDYGSFGMLTPCVTAVAVIDRPLTRRTRAWQLALFSAMLIAVALTNPFTERQFWALAAVPLLALYNGQPGKYRFKYGFYLFYPVHLLLLQAIAMWV